MKTLLIITETFPIGGVTEAAFLNPEFGMLKGKFDRIVIVPKIYEGKFVEPQPTKDFQVDARFSKVPRMSFVEALKGMTSTYVWRQIAADPRALFSLSKLRKLLSATHRAKLFAQWLEREYPASQESKIVIYSFWFDMGAIAAVFLPPSPFRRFYSRAHRVDLYDLPGEYKSPRLRQDTLAAIEGVWSCSEFGANYLRKSFPKYRDKIHCAYLGSFKSQAGYVPTPKEDDPFTFVTICRLASVKRVGFALDCIKELVKANPQRKFRWIVIGEGPERNSIELKICHKHANLEVKMLGQLDNAEVQKYLVTNPIHFFVLLSENEGLPISILESLSYGIPVIASNINGIPEAIKHGENGLLMDLSQNPKDFVKTVSPFLQQPQLWQRMSHSAKIIWQNHFDATQTRKDFINLLSTTL